MSSRTRILSASFLSIASILLIGFFGLNSIRRFDDSHKWVIHTQQVINETRLVLVYCADLETASRGFAITADSEYLEPYHEARTHIDNCFRQLKKLTRDNPLQSKEVFVLEQLVEKKARFCDKINAICASEGKMAAQDMISGRRGLKLMASIREKVSRIIESENKLLGGRSRKTEENYVTTYRLIVFSLVGSVLVLLLTFYFLLRDLRVRVANEKKIRDNEHELKQFFDTIPVGILILDMDKKPYYANKQAMELMGIDQLDKLNILDLDNVQHTQTGEAYQPPQESLRELFGENREIQRNDLVMKSDGKEIYLSIRSVAVRDSDDEISFVMSILEDVSLQHAAEQELLRAKKFAEDSDKQKEIFLTNMSHEIRTPMNAIVGFTTLLGDTALTKEQEDYLGSIRIASGNLLHIINDILDLSKIQSGHIHFEKLDFRTSEILEDLSRVHLPEIEEKGLKLDLYVAHDVPAYVKGDPMRLRQVLTNLLGNAIKFSKRGNISIKVEKIQENADELELAFSVSDQGIGIEADKLPFIFDRFTQADFDTNRLYGGTGLGLNITKSLVEQQKGSISVESRKNEGTTFRFVIPFKKAETSAGSSHVKTAEKQELPATSLWILLVEDNVLNQKLALRVMKDFGYRVDTAVNGREALEKIKEREYDLILMDLQMPELDGYQTAHILRKEFKLTTPIIAMTAHSLAGERDKCFEAGMNDYISKPFKFEQLKMKIDQAVKNAASSEKAANPYPEVKKQLEELSVSLEKSNFMESKMLIFKIKSQLAGDNMIDATLFSRLEQLIREKAESTLLMGEFHTLIAELNQKLR